MKRVIFLMAIFVLFNSFCFGADYALDKGANMFGMTANYINAAGELYENKGESFTGILLMPHTVRFFRRNLGLGGDLLVLLTGQGDNKLVTLGVGPKIMYFFGGKDKKSHPYLTSGFYYLRNDIEYDDLELHQSGTRFKIGLGVNSMLASHLGLLLEVSYNLDNLKEEDKEKSDSGSMLIVSMGLAGFIF